VIRSALRAPSFVVAVLVLAFCAAGMSAAISAYKVYLRKLPIYAPQGRLLRALPAETGADQTVDAETLTVLGTENYVTRVYTLRDPEPGEPARLELHAAYYTNQIDTVPHVVDRCFTGAGLALVGGPWNIDVPLHSGGWAIDQDGVEGGEPVYTVRLSNEFSNFGGGRRVRLPRGLTPDRPLQLRITKFVDQHGNALFAGYLFLANGGWVANANELRTLAFNLSEDYAYYLKVQVTSSQARTPEELAVMAGSLLDDLLGEVMCCVPDWVEVQAGRYPDDNPRRKDSAAP
jgi:hypothetical protein